MINNGEAILIKCQIKLYVDDVKAWGNFMEHGTIMILSIISVAAIAAVTIGYYQTASDKVVGAQCDKSKLVCRVRSETTHFGGYLPTYSYSYIPFPVYGAGLGIYSSGLDLENRSDCDRCLDNVTDRDEQQIITSKSPVPESELSLQKRISQLTRAKQL
ncbi:hypothetical protein [Nitrososphaera sp. AFS]|jgi:hypothetical protein|uniref:hypothetical protein n=1 Tax=Nitrososphaera sp. AFS TaxID=2301191 RepID=UPI0013922FA6|nr:hypothetical protein [Nitrososphaera sp. AFS]NAL78068.1 hypothetical protein [Nitrososphaera sp. AFS]